jgi:hypothetical protein
MGKKKADNVVPIKTAKYTEQEQKFYAEVLMKDDPSKEAQAWFQKELNSSSEAWRKLGDLTKEAADQALKDFWMGYATNAAVQHGAELLKAELGYENAPPLIRLLIEQAVLCHIRLGMIEHLYSTLHFPQAFAPESECRPLCCVSFQDEFGDKSSEGYGTMACYAVSNIFFCPVLSL